MRKTDDARDAWRALERRMFAEQIIYGDDEAGGFDWSKARFMARNAVEQWRERPLEVVHPKIATLAELIQAVIAAEAA